MEKRVTYEFTDWEIEILVDGLDLLLDRESRLLDRQQVRNTARELKYALEDYR